MEKNSKRTINSWAMYDWANSAYNLVIASTIFPIFFSNVTPDKILFMGQELSDSTLYGYSISFSFLVIAFISPLLSGIADYGGKKKVFMQVFCYIGSLACCSLFFFNGNTLWIGLTGSILASIGYAGSIVFYNAFLPEIASISHQDRVSAKGFALGYIGSSILLLASLVIISNPEFFGIQDTLMATKVCFLLVGIWWFGFAQITFYNLPANVYNRKPTGNIVFKGYQELMAVFKEFMRTPRLNLFLPGFFFYNMGVQTVMYLATFFGLKLLGLSSNQLIMTILVIQFVAIGGAYLFSGLSRKYGNIPVLCGAVLIWIIVCISAYFVYTANAFYLLASLVGFVMGGIQALSRSTYSKLLPKSMDHASYFSFYDVSEKIGIVLGTALFATIAEISGSMRNSVFPLILFFIIGFIFLLLVNRRLKMKSEGL